MPRKVLNRIGTGYLWSYKDNLEWDLPVRIFISHGFVIVLSPRDRRGYHTPRDIHKSPRMHNNDKLIINISHMRNPCRIIRMQAQSVSVLIYCKKDRPGWAQLWSHVGSRFVFTLLAITGHQKVSMPYGHSRNPKYSFTSLGCFQGAFIR